jgi:hypothetical protein
MIEEEAGFGVQGSGKKGFGVQRFTVQRVINLPENSTVMPDSIRHPESQWTPASAGGATSCEAIIFIIGLIRLRRVRRLSATDIFS